MFLLKLMTKEEGGLRTGCPADANYTTKQNHKTHLSGQLVKLRSHIWQCILEASQAPLRAALGVFTDSKKKNQDQEPHNKTNIRCNKSPLHLASWKRNGIESYRGELAKPWQSKEKLRSVEKGAASLADMASFSRHWTWGLRRILLQSTVSLSLV